MFQPITLRPYQEHDINRVRLAFRDHRRVLLVQPTGAGKGTAIAYMVHGAIARGKHVQFWVNRRTLVHDMSGRLDKLGVDHGVIMANHHRSRPWVRAQVASIDTLRNRQHLPHADLIIIDEAHFAVSDGWKMMMGRYPNAKFILTTATPIRLDGRGLEEIADTMIVGPGVQDLIDQGYLVPSRVYAPTRPDLSGVTSSGSDYNQKQLAQVCDRPKLVGDIVSHWRKLSSNRKTVCFAIDQHHANAISEQFRMAGIVSAPVLDDTSDEDRDRIWHDLDHGGLRVLTSVGVISYGWDHPIVSSVILARPTESLQLHLQQMGRGSRLYPGKRDFLVLDHACNVERHGFYEDHREWSLQGEVRTSKGKAEDDGPCVSTCRTCFCTFKSGLPACPACGSRVIVNHRQVRQVEGELQELRREKKAAAIDEWRERQDGEARKQKYFEFKRTAEEMGYKPGWPKIKFKTTFGKWAPVAWDDEYEFLKRKAEEEARQQAELAAAQMAVGL